MRPRTLIISLDPGGTTGVSSYYMLSEDKSPSSGGSFDYRETFNGKQFGPEPHFKALWYYLADMNPDVIVCEDFVYQGKNNVELISRDYIGVVKLYCELTRKPLQMQQPWMKEPTWLNNNALNKIGVYHRGRPHQNDATRHLIYYVVQTLGRKEILNELRT